LIFGSHIRLLASSDKILQRPFVEAISENLIVLIDAPNVGNNLPTHRTFPAIVSKSPISIKCTTRHNIMPEDQES